MQKTALPGLPARRAADYELDGFAPPRYARVIYTPQEATKERIVIQCQAFEVDEFGLFLAAPNGEPSRTAGTAHAISLSGIGDTHTLVPAWVRVVGTYAADALPAGCTEVDGLPATGEEGQLVYLAPTMYRWELGLVENVMAAKAGELAALLNNSAAIASFEL